MYELQIRHERLGPTTLPTDIASAFGSYLESTTDVSVVPWEEHCTECAMPQCYESCDLYEARTDGKCRRFIGGGTVIAGLANVQGFALRVRFKRWGQLMAYGNTHLVPVARAHRLERFAAASARFAAALPDDSLTIAGRSGWSARLVRRLLRAITTRGWLANADARPDAFVAEVYNPGEAEVRLALTIRHPAGSVDVPPFQELWSVAPGYQLLEVPFERIAPHLVASQELHLMVTPNLTRAEDEGLELVFGDLGFVRRASGAEKAVKIVIWDLDNTVWDGVLVEDGPESLRLKDGVAGVIRELDRRGIVNSAVSKNNEDEALAQLRRFGIDEYFVFPRIGWGPKSQAVGQVIADFNVGANTVVFLDDQPFERAEVAEVHPDVRVLDAGEYETLLARPAFDPVVTAEAGRRREFYLGQGQRRSAAAEFGGDYFDFLRSCEIVVRLRTGTTGSLDRVHELVQRTNQMNFSPNRYTRDELEARIADPGVEAFALDCEDRFGDYGTVGFALVDRSGPTLQDLMFSCRVQSKRVEHAFLAFLLARYRDLGARELQAIYHRTDRNAPAGRVFDDLGFSEAALEGDVVTLRFDLSREIPDDGVMRVVVE